MKHDSTKTGLMAGPVRLDPTVIQGDGYIIDLRAILALLWRGKYIVIICILIGGIFATLIISDLDARFKASATVMFDIQKTNVINLSDVVVEQEFGKDTLQNQIQILRSKGLIQRVINDQNLTLVAEFNPTLQVEKKTIISRIQNVFSVPPELKNLLMDIGLTSPPSPPPTADVKARRERLAIVENVRSRLSLAPIKGSRVIEVSFTSGNPDLSSRIVNAISDQYIVDQLDAKLEATRAATSWLTERVTELQTRVETSESDVEVARARLSLEAGQGLAITQQQLEALNGSLALTRNRVSEMDAQNTRLQNAMDRGLDIGAIPEFRNSLLIQKYRDQESDLRSQESVLVTAVPEGHPSLTLLRKQLSDVRLNIEVEAQRVIAAIQIELDSLSAQEAALIAEVRELETKSLSQSANEVELRQLEREAQANRVLYESFLGRLQETSAQEDLQGADARVLSSAEPPNNAETQRKKIILLLGLTLGTASGVVIVFLLDHLNNTFRSPNQITEMTGENVLATIPAGGSRMKRPEVVQLLREKPNGALAESVRNLRTSILFSNLDKPPKVVMFTSSVPREGKSTTSMMLAMTSRQMGKTAVIVDCDLRMPALAKLLQVNDDQPGLLSVMEGTAQVRDALYRDEESGLHVLMAKPNERPAQINAADILSSKKFHDLVIALSQQYDLVILDTPPTLVVTDARIVSKIADAIIYAIRWDETPRDAVEEGLKELRSIDAPITGIVLTMINEAKVSKYSYDGYSYHKGRYRDYYEA